MEKEFIPYEQALELKELGFDEPCFAFHNHNHQLVRYINPDKDWNSLFNQTLKNSKITLPDTYTAPTYQQAFRWFRKKYGLYGIPREWTLDNFSYEIKSNKEGAITFKVYGGYPLNFKTYEEAELACLIKLIEIIKTK